MLCAAEMTHNLAQSVDNIHIVYINNYQSLFSLQAEVWETEYSDPAMATVTAWRQKL